MLKLLLQQVCDPTAETLTALTQALDKTDDLGGDTFNYWLPEDAYVAAIYFQTGMLQDLLLKN